MNANLPALPSLAQLQSEAAEKSTEQLLTELSQSLTVTAEYLMRSAVLWNELEKRGQDLSHLRHGAMAYLPMIANGTLDARAVVGFAGQKTLLASVSRLPIAEQQRLLDNHNQVQIVSLAEDKTQIVRTADIADLSAAEIYQVIGDGEIKTPEQQYQALLIRDKSKVKTKTKSAKPYRMTSNIKLDGDVLVVAGKHGINIEKLRELLQAA